MDTTEAVSHLAASRDRFLTFVRARVSDPDLAEDIVQSSLARAVERFDSLHDEERLVPWFYAILRNAIVDAHRRRGAGREVEFPDGFDVAEEPAEAERRLCECFAGLLPSMRPEYAALIQAIDLEAEPPAGAAQRLGITPNNLKVRHHRARQALRRSLEETCRVCAEHHCLDCTCGLNQMRTFAAGEV